jgi:hypothetical protein
MPADKRWIVTTSGDRKIGEVSQELTRAGFSVDKVLDEIGSITGAASDAVAQKLSGLRGVADISPELQIDIGPPGGSNTW